MSFNRELIHHPLDLQGNEIMNAKPQHFDKHPTVGLFSGFEYFNTIDNVKYIFNGISWIDQKGPKGDKGLTGNPGKDATLTSAAGEGLSYNTITKKLDLGTVAAKDGTIYDLKTLGEIINKLEKRVAELEKGV